MSFAQLNLDSHISKAILNCGYTTPTPIQARCIPDILEGKDLVASAQTGTGKTAAFVLPALQRLSIQRQTQKPRILILTPTRELASQITQAATKYGKFIRFNMASLVGGMPYRQQIRDLSRAVDIIVATPGRLLDHVENGRLDLSGIEMLILDEADRMLDMGFIDDVQAIANATPKDRQTLLFSATVDDKLAHIVRHLLKSPVRIDLSTATASPLLIKQEVYMADNFQHRTRLLNHFLENGNIYKAIIFSATKINADKLAADLRDKGFPAAPLHGDLKQNVRNRTIEQLRRGSIQFLVATDVAARGIDISDLTHVINFDLPRFCEDYVHRIGRTGRAGKSGIAISFVMPADARHLQKIEKFIGQKIQKEIVVGLEPSKRSASSADFAPTKKKKFGKSGGGKSFSGGKRDGAKSSSGFKKERDGSSKDGARSFSGFKKERDGVKSFSGDRKERSGSSRDGAKSFSGFKKERDSSSRDGERKFSGARKERDGVRSFSSDRKERDGTRSFSSDRKERDGTRSFSGGRRDRDSTSKDGARSFSGGRSAPKDGAKSFSVRKDRDGSSRDGAKSFSGRKEKDGAKSFSDRRPKDGAPKTGAKRFSDKPKKKEEY